MGITHSRIEYLDFIKRKPEWPRIMSEGDSWFSYPLSINLITRMSKVDKQINVLRLEHSGDDILDVIGDKTGNALDEGEIVGKAGYQEKRLRSLLKNPLTRPRVLMFSAGGNDIIGPEMSRYLRTWSDAVAQAGSARDITPDAVLLPVFDDTLDRIEASYRQLVSLRNQACGSPARTWIVTHTYTPPQPRNVKGPFGIGPWMYPAFRARGYTSARSVLMFQVVFRMIERFRERLLRVQANSEHFHVVDLMARKLGGGAWLLDPAPFDAPTKTPGWKDEIHPDDPGFTALFRAFRPTLRAAFPQSKF